MKTSILASALLVLATTACTVTKVLEPTGGSRADGTVKLSYILEPFEKPKVDWDLAASKAAQRCYAWGYSGAEPFGGATQVCNMRDGYGGCIQAVVSVEYQCTGGPNR